VSAPKFKVLDVRPILARGEDPYGKIRAATGSLAPAQGLTVIAPFLPAPLIEVLKSEGFRSAPEHRSDGGWAVNSWHE